MNEQLSLDEAKKIKRLGWPQKKSRFYWQKRTHSSVYDLKDNRDQKNWGFCTYDAPTDEEFKAVLLSYHLPTKLMLYICSRLNIRAKVIDMTGFSEEFESLTSDSIHEIIACPKGEEHLSGVWVMGKTQPVRLLPEEFEFFINQ